MDAIEYDNLQKILEQREELDELRHKSDDTGQKILARIDELIKIARREAEMTWEMKQIMQRLLDKPRA